MRHSRQGCCAGRTAGYVGQQLWKELLSLARKPKFCKGKYPAKGPLHRQKMRLWQSLCIVSNFCKAGHGTDDVQMVWAALQVSQSRKEGHG